MRRNRQSNQRLNRRIATKMLAVFLTAALIMGASSVVTAAASTAATAPATTAAAATTTIAAPATTAAANTASVTTAAVTTIASAVTTAKSATQATTAKAATTATTATTTSTSATTAASGENSGAETVQTYPEKDGVVTLTLDAMYSRIKVDNEEYKVQQKRAEIYKRRLTNAMNDKREAEMQPPPLLSKPVARSNWEKQKYTTWKTAELECEKYENDLINKYNSIKSSLKSQYISILDMQQSLKTYGDEMAKLEANILQTETRMSVGQAKQSDIDALMVQKEKLEADIVARQRH